MKNFFKNAKTKLAVVGASVAGASSAFGAVAFDPVTKNLTGNLEMGTYYSGVEIALAAIAIIIGITLVFGVLRKVR